MTTQVWNGSEFVEMPAAPYTASGVGTLTEGAPEDLDTLAEIAAELSEHAHSGTYVPVPADPPTPGQILSATDDDPLTTDWIDAPSGGGGSAVAEGRGVLGGTTRLATPGVRGVSVSTQTMANNTITYEPRLVATSITLDQLVVEVTTAGSAGSLLRIGIYSADTDWQPTALVLDGGTVAADSLGVKTLAISQVLSAGRYLFAMNNNSTSGVALRVVRGELGWGYPPTLGGSLFVVRADVSAAYGALPTSSIPAPNANGAASTPTVHGIFCRVSVP